MKQTAELEDGAFWGATLDGQGETPSHSQWSEGGNQVESGEELAGPREHSKGDVGWRLAEQGGGPSGWSKLWMEGGN